mgnify:CR=1 FL=1
MISPLPPQTPVVVAARRTPVGTAGHGLADVDAADLAAREGGVGVEADLGREVEGDGKPFLPGGEVAAIESVGLFGGGETGVLANGPWLGGIHGGTRAANVRCQAGKRASYLQIIEVGFGIQRLDGDPFRGLMNQRVDSFLPTAQFLVGKLLPLLHVRHYLLRKTQSK